MRYIKYLFFSILLACTQHNFAQTAIDNATQGAADEKKLQEYFKEHGIRPLKASGIYYTISKPGSGPKIKTGQTATLDYTGRMLDGAVFDSNTDPRFQHPEPLNVQVGAGRVIKGWEAGLPLLKKGSTATFYIPSGMAYGARGKGKIPPNSILVFDIEVSDVTE